MIILGYLAAVLMGIVLGVIGGGGSILTVPILVYLMGVAPDIATGYSLLIVGATAAFGASRYFKQGLIDISSALAFAIPSIIAVYLSRAFLMPAIPEQIMTSPFSISKNTAIMVLFALLMLASATLMLRKAYKKQANATSIDQISTTTKTPNWPLIMFEGAVVGVVTGILGAGGGFLIIPALVLFLSMPMLNAVGASLFIIALKSLIGFIGDLQSGIELQLPLLPYMMVATFIGMAISTKISGKLDGNTLQKIFAFFTLVIAIVIIFKEIY
ncbi:sulfite exporter TauE/SafE family protein [Thalassotalea crassostreae]|uniref:sulfite exporter TauE/SafE family protein n=1 Tax=Thalassotalea crassostreae TaxID=1763536 RepID=UPI000838E1A7|nr:sulfite exporter TauE/SafE family protein [Thalassotalea crassostreae]